MGLTGDPQVRGLSSVIFDGLLTLIYLMSKVIMTVLVCIDVPKFAPDMPDIYWMRWAGRTPKHWRLWLALVTMLKMAVPSTSTMIVSPWAFQRLEVITDSVSPTPSRSTTTEEMEERSW